MKIMIMCSGHGMRLGRLTEKAPKALIKLHGKTILQIKLEEYCRLGKAIRLNDSVPLRATSISGILLYLS